jgi:Nucleotide-diphospho-sugar transferase
MGYRIISGYTINTPYEQEIKDLEQGLNKFNLPYTFYPYNNTGSWVKNTLVKPTLIQKALNTYTEDIIWIDADAIIKKDPIFFKSIQDENFDICCHFLKTGYNPRELLTGTFYFKNNNIVKDLVNDWIINTKLKTDWDQRILQTLVDGKYKDILKIIILPIEYIKINPKNNKDITLLQCVIGHKQLSRKMRTQIGK